MSGRSQTFFLSVCILIGPVLLFGLYKLRQFSRGVLQAERDALPYDSKPEPMPGFLLRRFSAPEQKYLRQLLRTTGYLFPLLTWLTFGIFILPASDVELFTHNTWNNPPVFLWLRILLGATTFVGTTCYIFGIVMANLVTTPLRFGPSARFYRTRPLGIGFLFWTNALVALGTELAAILIGFGAGMLLLAAIHGPIWMHLPPAFPGTLVPNDGKLELYASLLATSPPRVLLSICTTITLSFSVFTVLLATPYALPGTRSSRPNAVVILAMTLGMFAFLALNIARIFRAASIPAWLFMYAELGPPPPYAYALVPVSLSAGLLLLARYFIGKTEV
ncbi:MAG: hypothetical protein ABSG51_11780 [Terracidiphilus sp.]|jgi:hypothetical protein